MTRKNLSYIGLLLSAMFATACSDDVVEGGGTLSGDGKKTPIEVRGLLDAGGSAKTRAAGMEFDATTGDQLVAYLRHVTWEGPVAAGQPQNSRAQDHTAGFNKLVTFTAKGSTAYTGDDIKPIGLGGDVVVATKEGNVTNQANSLTASPAIYWDDFSANSDKDGTNQSTDIRDDKHYLQSYYGYCYNGGTPTEGLETGDNKEKGIIKWSVATDQTASDKSAFQHSDLLWSAEQTPIKYAHVDVQGNREHGTLILPYTHAMSKVTIKVTVADGFASDYKFTTGITTTLHSMYSTCRCTAPTYTIDERGTSVGTNEVTNITMWQGNTEKAKTCTYEAIVVPSILSVVNPFATISGLDGNDYVIPITDAMLQKGSLNSNKGWGDQLTETEENIQSGTAQSRPHVPTDGQNANTTSTIPKGKGFMMKSGVNYVLNVTISKQQITVSALIKDWQNVEAVGEARVQFTSDVDGKGSIDEGLQSGGFDVYKSDNNSAFESKITTLTWDQTNSKWTYNPVIYWAGQQDMSYFRALSPNGQNTSMNQERDVLWGYACDDIANNRDKVGTEGEVMINPRTGDVPLHFEHVMSKISVQLKTADGDHTSPTSSAVDLTDAKIEISNLFKEGTLELVKGEISTEGKTKAATAIGSTTAISNLAVIPQNIADESILKITLKDNTVYKLKLNECKVQTGTDPDTSDPIYGDFITQWQRGKHYTYTINVEKEAITFRAMIKAWDEKEGSGNATLEWD